MNSQTRLREFQNYSKTQKFISVIGHGTLVNSRNNSIYFKVPPGMTIIFVSKPGYLIALGTLRDDKMTSLLHSETKLRRFIDDKLPDNEIPDIIKRANWNWKNHIYTTGMTCPNMALEFYDTTDTSWGRWYNEQSGVWYPGTNRRPEYKGKKGTLKNLVSSLSTKGIMFVFGCRGDPETSQRTSEAYHTVGTFGGPQTYKIPRTSLVRTIETLERSAARYLARKRARASELSLRKNNNQPSAKRTRT